MFLAPGLVAQWWPGFARPLCLPWLSPLAAAAPQGAQGACPTVILAPRRPGVPAGGCVVIDGPSVADGVQWSQVGAAGFLFARNIGANPLSEGDDKGTVGFRNAV